MKQFKDPRVLRVAKRALKHGPLCDHCLGRQLAQVSTGLTNRRRGVIVRRLLRVKEARSCRVCSGLFSNLDRYAKEAVEKLAKLRFKTFLVGSRLSKELVRSEEGLWEDIGIEYCEPMKSELNREVGKLIWKLMNKAGIKAEVDEKSPDITIFLDLGLGRVQVKINPLFLYGEYKKLVRGIPQTKWDKYEETVEDIIAGPIMAKTLGSSHSMHAAGREDIDARCLDWRPFVFEVKEPKRRRIVYRRAEQAINRTRKVRVRGLRPSGRKEVVRVKDMRQEKTYRMRVRFKKSVRNIKALDRLVGEISQRTPIRVAHRRADLVRKRQVKAIKYKKIKAKEYEITVRGEAGLYVKELMTGDQDRTKPSAAGVLKNPAEVIALDVIRIHKVK